MTIGVSSILGRRECSKISTTFVVYKDWKDRPDLDQDKIIGA